MDSLDTLSTGVSVETICAIHSGRTSRSRGSRRTSRTSSTGGAISPVSSDEGGEPGDLSTDEAVSYGHLVGRGAIRSVSPVSTGGSSGTLGSSDATSLCELGPQPGKFSTEAPIHRSTPVKSGHTVRRQGTIDDYDVVHLSSEGVVREVGGIEGTEEKLAL